MDEDVSQQLWRFVMRLERELSEEALELCWERLQFEGGELALHSLGSLNSSGSPAPNSAKERPSEAASTPEDKHNLGVGERAEDAPAIAAKKNQNTPQATLQNTPQATPRDWIQSIVHCQDCSLGQEKTRVRRQAIIGGPSSEREVPVLLVCDAPSYEADQLSAALDAEHLEYLKRWLGAIGLSDAYFLTNLVKCRTPGNRAAWPEEVKACEKHLQQQVKHLKPKAILALGSSAARSLSQQRSDLNSLREAKLSYAAENRNIPLFVTYSVAEVLRNPGELRPPVWEDLKRLQAFLQNSAEHKS